MTAILSLLGTLILTFWVSRAFLAVLRRTSLSVRQQLLLGHAASLALIGLFVVYVKVFNVYAPFAYVPGQLLWFVLDWLRQQQAAKPVSRRRRSSSNKRSLPTIKLPEWMLRGAMGVLTILYVGYNWMVFDYETKSYHDVIIGSTPAEVVYAVNKPVMARNGDAESWKPAQDAPRSAQWMYTNPFMVINFNSDQTVANIVCSNQDKVSTGACVPTVKTDIGDQDATVWARLGFPTRLITTDDGKHIYSYPELGHDFVLEQFYVRSMRIYPRNGDAGGWWWRFFLYMLP
jgi:hypothetical protein